MKYMSYEGILTRITTLCFAEKFHGKGIKWTVVRKSKHIEHMEHSGLSLKKLKLRVGKAIANS